MVELSEYLNGLVEKGEYGNIAEAIKERCIWCDDELIKEVKGTREAEADEKFNSCSLIFKFKDKHFLVYWVENHISWEETEIDLYGLSLSSIYEVEQKEVTTVQWVKKTDN